MFIHCLTITSLFILITLASAQDNGEAIFKQKCTACHTIGKGKLVGPDLQGVTSRRDDAWLHKQIKSPDLMIAEGDPIATQLVKEMNGVPMAPLGLSDAEVDAVIAFLKNASKQQAAVDTGLPSQYFPTILISIGVLIALTIIGLLAGKKQVEVR
ncbi:MAG: cytochrome c [Bacteroidetes bacterium]|nr:cytochrome c [Bacteroidota bacterium]